MYKLSPISRLYMRCAKIQVAHKLKIRPAACLWNCLHSASGILALVRSALLFRSNISFTMGKSTLEYVKDLKDKINEGSSSLNDWSALKQDHPLRKCPHLSTLTRFKVNQLTTL